MFWLIAAWLAVVGLSSLVPQIFGPPFRRAASGESCAEDLHDLSEELLDRTGDWLKGHPERNTRDKLQAYFADFDRRLMHTKLSCTENERAAFTELSRLRHGVSALLERFEREELPHVRRLNELLDRQGVPSP